MKIQAIPSCPYCGNDRIRLTQMGDYFCLCCKRYFVNPFLIDEEGNVYDESIFKEDVPEKEDNENP